MHKGLWSMWPDHTQLMWSLISFIKPPDSVSHHFPQCQYCGNIWPLHSLDTKPCTFFLWGFSKDKLLMRKPTTLMELRGLICVSEFLKTCGTIRLHGCTFVLKRSWSRTLILFNNLYIRDNYPHFWAIVYVCVIFKIFLWDTECKQNLNGSTFCGPPCILNPNSLANLLCLVLWREEYASHSLPVSPFAHQTLGKPPSEIKLTFLYYTYFRKLLKMSSKQ